MRNWYSVNPHISSLYHQPKHLALSQFQLVLQTVKTNTNTNAKQICRATFLSLAPARPGTLVSPPTRPRGGLTAHEFHLMKPCYLLRIVHWAEPSLGHPFPSHPTPSHHPTLFHLCPPSHRAPKHGMVAKIAHGPWVGICPSFLPIALSLSSFLPRPQPLSSLIDKFQRD